MKLVDPPAWEAVRAELKLDEDRIIVSRSKEPKNMKRHHTRMGDHDPESGMGMVLQKLRAGQGEIVFLIDARCEVSRLRKEGCEIQTVPWHRLVKKGPAGSTAYRLISESTVAKGI
jgi:hypothetical protein